MIKRRAYHWARRGNRSVVVVGVCSMTFGLPANDSLKGKRRIVRRIVDRTRNEFNAAVAEVGHLDEHRRAAIGFAVLSNDARHANSMLDKISRFASGLTEAVVLDRSIEMLHVEPERSIYGNAPALRGGASESPMNAFGPEVEDWSDDDPDDPDREPFER